MGAIFTQEVATARWDEFIAWLRGGEGQLVGTSLKGTQIIWKRSTASPASY